MHRYTHTQRHTLRICMRTRTHTRTHTDTHKYTYPYRHTHVYAHTYEHTNARTHTTMRGILSIINNASSTLPNTVGRRRPLSFPGIGHWRTWRFARHRGMWLGLVQLVILFYTLVSRHTPRWYIQPRWPSQWTAPCCIAVLKSSVVTLYVQSRVRSIRFK